MQSDDLVFEDNGESYQLTNPADVARLVLANEDGVITGNVTWQSYVDVHDDGTITVDVYPDLIPMFEVEVPTYRYRIEHIGSAAPVGPAK